MIHYVQLRDTVVGAIPSEEADAIMIPATHRLGSAYRFIIRGVDMARGGGRRPLTGGQFGPEGLARMCDYKISPLGRRFVASLRIQQ